MPQDLLIHPLAVASVYGPSPFAMALSAALFQGAAVARAGVRYKRTGAWRLAWWPLAVGFAAPGLAYGLRYPDPVVLALFAAPALGLIVTAMMPAISRRLGRPLNLAGWLLGPTVALTLAGALAAWTLSVPSIEAMSAETRVTFLSVGLSGLAMMALPTVLVGATVSLSALHRDARRAGLSSRLASVGALMVCAGLFFECHRALTIAWWRNDYAMAMEAWAFRGQVLTAALGLALLPTLAHALGHRPRPDQRRGLRRAAVMLGGVAALFALNLGRVATQLDRIHGAESFILAAPVCPYGTCPDTDVNIDVNIDAGPRPYPQFYSVGVIPARYQP